MRKRTKLFIFHFQPLENYPPIQNLLRFFYNHDLDDKVQCISTNGSLEIESFGVNVKRLGNSQLGRFRLLWSYLYFNLYSLIILIKIRPKNIMYYETYSCFPAFIYKNIINKKAGLYIHFHEYTTITEYSNGGFVNKFFHWLEQGLFKKARWISHTNQTRLDKFLKDERLEFNENRHFVAPNFPSNDWPIKNTKWKEGELLKFIYVGFAADSHSVYINELVEYLRMQPVKSELNIYCVKENSIPSDLLGESGNTTVNSYKPIHYKDLSKTIAQHHVGVILYKGLIENYIYNAPNKLFEYLSCGLNVIYPEVMKGCYGYDTNCIPKVIRLNFNNMDDCDIYNMANSIGEETKVDFSAESIYKNLLDNNILN